MTIARYPHPRLTGFASLVLLLGAGLMCHPAGGPFGLALFLSVTQALGWWQTFGPGPIRTRWLATAVVPLPGVFLGCLLLWLFEHDFQGSQLELRTVDLQVLWVGVAIWLAIQVGAAATQVTLWGLSQLFGIRNRAGESGAYRIAIADVLVFTGGVAVWLAAAGAIVEGVVDFSPRMVDLGEDLSSINPWNGVGYAAVVVAIANGIAATAMTLPLTALRLELDSHGPRQRQVRWAWLLGIELLLCWLGSMAIPFSILAVAMIFSLSLIGLAIGNSARHGVELDRNRAKVVRTSN